MAFPRPQPSFRTSSSTHRIPYAFALADARNVAASSPNAFALDTRRHMRGRVHGVRVDRAFGDARGDRDPTVAIRDRWRAQDARIGDALLPPPRRAPLRIGARRGRGPPQLALQGGFGERARRRLAQLDFGLVGDARRRPSAPPAHMPPVGRRALAGARGGPRDLAGRRHGDSRITTSLGGTLSCKRNCSWCDALAWATS